MVQPASHGQAGLQDRRAPEEAEKVDPRGVQTAHSCDDAGEPPRVPFFHDPYAPHFEEIGRALDFYEDFVLLPVEVPSVDVGVALCRWLERNGHPLQVLSPESFEGRRLAPALLSLPAQACDPVVVMGPRQRVTELPAALSLLNLRRDTVRQHLRRPLLWCGLRSFLDETWENAPDFWSIREIAMRIPLLPTHDTAYLGDSGPWIEPTPPPETVREQVGVARKTKDGPNLARALLLLARSLLARGRLGDAEQAHREATEIMATLPSFSRTIEEALAEETLGDLTALRGMRGAGKSEYERALATYELIGDAHGKTRVTGKLGIVAHAAGDHGEAARWLETAMQAADDLGDDSLRAPLLHALGRLRRDADSAFDAAAAHYEEAMRLFQRLDDRAGEAQVLLARSHLRHDQSDFTGALADSDAATSIFAALDDRRGQSEALAQRGHVHVHLGNYLDAREALDMALSRGKDIQSTEWLGRVVSERGAVREQLDDLAGAAKDLEVALGAQLGSYHRATALMRRSDVRHARKEHQGALADLLAARPLFQAAGHTRCGCMSTCLLSLAHQQAKHENRLEDAEATLDAAMAILTRPTSKRAWALRERGSTRFRRGDFPGALADYDTALDIHRGLESAGGQAIVLQNRGWHRYWRAYEERSSLLPALGSMSGLAWIRAYLSAYRSSSQLLDSALRDYEEALAVLDPTKNGVLYAAILCDVGQLHLFRNEPDLARDSFDRALRASDAKHSRGGALALRARAHLLTGDLSSARSDLVAARALYHAAGRPVDEASTLKDLGVVAKRDGQLEDALRLLAEARRRYEEYAPGRSDEHILTEIAHVHFLAGRPSEARAAAQRALDLSSHNDTAGTGARSLLRLLEMYPRGATWAVKALSSGRGAALVLRVQRRFRPAITLAASLVPDAKGTPSSETGTARPESLGADPASQLTSPGSPCSPRPRGLFSWRSRRPR